MTSHFAIGIYRPNPYLLGAVGSRQTQEIDTPSAVEQFASAREKLAQGLFERHKELALSKIDSRNFPVAQFMSCLRICGMDLIMKNPGIKNIKNVTHAIYFAEDTDELKTVLQALQRVAIQRDDAQSQAIIEDLQRTINTETSTLRAPISSDQL